jgi:hypothetical protein
MSPGSGIARNVKNPGDGKVGAATMTANGPELGVSPGATGFTFEADALEFSACRAGGQAMVR